MAKYSGVPVWIGDRRLIIPALSVLQLRQHREILRRYNTFASEEPSDEELGKLVACIGDAVRRNYPDVADDDLMPELDMRSIPEAVRAIINQTELVAVRPGEPEDQGPKS